MMKTLRPPQSNAAPLRPLGTAQAITSPIGAGEGPIVGPRVNTQVQPLASAVTEGIPTSSISGPINPVTPVSVPKPMTTATTDVQGSAAEGGNEEPASVYWARWAQQHGDRAPVSLQQFMARSQYYRPGMGVVEQNNLMNKLYSQWQAYRSSFGMGGAAQAQQRIRLIGGTNRNRFFGGMSRG